MDMNAGKLYIVSTPIGNLGDITQRALDALGYCDAVYAEDTRVTGKLLASFGIKKPLFRLDENTIRHKAQGVVEDVLAGKTVCYCTDAGMPAVSDPGSHLVRIAHEVGISPEVLPGASAASLAYVASGFTCQNYYFGGFFPRKHGEQTALLETLKPLDAALVFYESPRRLLDALRSIRDVFPYRQVCVCRELTKLHEEVFRAPLNDVIEHFESMDAQGGIKGEIVIVVDSANPDERAEGSARNAEIAREMISELLASGERAKDIASKVAQFCGVPKNEAYEMVLQAKSGL